MMPTASDCIYHIKWGTGPRYLRTKQTQKLALVNLYSPVPELSVQHSEDRNLTL